MTIKQSAESVIKNAFVGKKFISSEFYDVEDVLYDSNSNQTDVKPKDLIGKTIGSMVAVMYIMEGSITTMKSTWNGPPGQLVRSLGKCFHPDTNIKLKNGNITKIKDINLGDILENGSVVQATMKIDNTDINTYEDLYIIKNGGVDNEDILVTGSHLIYNDGVFIPVKEYKDAIKSDIKTDVLSCLITSNHKIQIGNKIFWDWEDHFIKICPKRIDM
jgi:hypothetical protein